MAGGFGGAPGSSEFRAVDGRFYTDAARVPVRRAVRKSLPPPPVTSRMAGDCVRAVFWTRFALKGFFMIDATQFVTALYTGILGRGPDEKGLASNAARVENGAPPAEVARSFVQSAEFLKKFAAKINWRPLDSAKPLPIELAVTPDDGRRLWDRVESVWSKLGAEEPYYSLVPNPRWKSGEMTGGKNLDAFYATGLADMQRFDAWLARNGVSTDGAATCVELGCGVGRSTIWLARRFQRVVALDVSAPLLDLARKKAEAEGIGNVEFVHVRSAADLGPLAAADVFYSQGVLQHDPPPMIAEILDHAFAGLRAPGLAFFQIPTYRAGYAFDLKSWLDDGRDPGTETHVLPQKAIFDLAWRHGVKPLEAESDNALGAADGAISTTFLMEKVAMEKVAAKPAPKASAKKKVNQVPRPKRGAPG
ncbi:uncharacterized protein DUF4214 [Roseiarcus fermentans]|uniref:Uncharacterized protein DUF4214 n=2 Tax=Roseiarcus fermentans TaxID=1473586 RepID=A0A366F1J6_9HYPH|nr:uncharacterized protein DUF4214 [Roseiarcus fermentans]